MQQGTNDTLRRLSALALSILGAVAALSRLALAWRQAKRGRQWDQGGGDSGDGDGAAA